MNTRILVAEDDTHIRDGLKDTLETEGYTVTAVADGEAALRAFAEGSFDLVVLDIMMPKVNGYDVCRDIRRRNRAVPVLMLTAKGEELDKVLGLELGADDYVTKPFGIRELLARIAALLRRSKASLDADGLPDEFVFGPARINRRAYRGELQGRKFALSAKEMELLTTFYQHPGEALSREDLLKLVWDMDADCCTRTLDQHVAQLRKKIEPDPHRPVVLTTVHGIGYRYEG